MIVTRSWLQEWIDISDIATEDLAKTFNQIGLEVDRVVSYKMPEKIVFGKVLECEKHPEADKLNICQVDIGSSVRQIVCGAANVRAGLTVATATLGAKMPNGMEIKPVKLRGVDSDGMICSASELGLASFGSGIMEIDASIGEFTLGDEIGTNKYFNDDLIELELTANRGDCLSIMGVARDLSAAFNRALKTENHRNTVEDNHIGIGRILQLHVNETQEVALEYKAVELKDVQTNLLIELRLAQIESVKENPLDALLFYATYDCGVILRAYNSEYFQNEGKAKIVVDKDSNNYNIVEGKDIASLIGVNQTEESKVQDDGIIFIEASYIDPDVVSRQMFEHKVEKDELFYRTSRGSEPELSWGMCTILNLLTKNSQSHVYSGEEEHSYEHQKRVVSLSVDEITAIIGMKIEKKKIIAILQDLGCDITKSQADTFVVEVPLYRHDIVNKQDVVEEIVRMIGIDNIESQPFVLKEENRFNDDYTVYKKRTHYRYKSADNGFFESVHFVFNEKEQLQKYGFETLSKDVDLLNPIVNTLDTLRSTLLLGLLNAASLNKKNGIKSVRLFEIGSVFNASREERVNMAFLFGGEYENDTLANAGKPAKISFDKFVQKVSNVIGDFELIEDITPSKLAHPYQAAKIIQNGKFIGTLFKLHPTVQADFDLEDTFLCELQFNELSYSLKTVKKYSKFQASFRDLSLIVSKDVQYETIKEIIKNSLTKEIVRFYPVDRYEDEKLGKNMSLTLRFVLQSNEKTLEEEDITNAMSSVLDALEEKLGITLR